MSVNNIILKSRENAQRFNFTKHFVQSDPNVTETVILGRGGLFPHVTDKRCSRNQAELSCTNGEFFIKQLGLNPMFLHRKRQKHLMMEKNKKYRLFNGDVFTLFADNYAFKVKLGGKSTELKNETVSDLKDTPLQSKATNSNYNRSITNNNNINNTKDDANGKQSDIIDLTETIKDTENKEHEMDIVKKNKRKVTEQNIPRSNKNDDNENSQGSKKSKI